MDCDGLVTSPATLGYVVLNAETVKSLNGDLQLLIDCMPEGATLSLNISSISPQTTLVIKKPLIVSSIHEEGTEIVCPNGRLGALEIRLAEQVLMLS